MSKKLSPTMQACRDFMRDHGGIERIPGGFWVAPGEKSWHGGKNLGWFGTTTIEALVARGVAEYSEWKDNKSGNGRFPVAAKLSSESSE